ncbi:MAG: GNAT family N-acetyltransferase [Gammaproteobacteria bacterium]
MTEPREQRVRLRPAGPGDEGFLRELHASTVQPEIALTGLDAGQMQLLLEQQYNARKSAYRLHYPGARYDIVEIDGLEAGVQCTDCSGEQILLVDLALLPQYRNQGTGSVLLTRLIDSAREQRKTLALHVLAGNPAQRLYERVGFLVTGTTPPYVRMEWRPATGAHP